MFDFYLKGSFLGPRKVIQKVVEHGNDSIHNSRVDKDTFDFRRHHAQNADGFAAH